MSRSNRKKRQILNNAISIYSNKDDQNNRLDSSYFINEHLIKDENNTPENNFLEKEGLYELIGFLQKELTDLEQDVLMLRLQGFSYREITDILTIQPKAVDNAIQRVRKKISNTYVKMKNAC